MVDPRATDAAFEHVTNKYGTGISATFGSVVVSKDGVLTLLDATGTVLTQTSRIQPQGDLCGLGFSTAGGRLYGRGAGKDDATHLTANSNKAFVENRMTYVPHYYSTDGYAALGVANVTTGSGKTNYFPADYSLSGTTITWSFTGPFELYLMPAASLDLGTKSYYDLIGTPLVPPRYGFGFIASRWGWQDRSYLESVLHNFRNGSYPIDAFITDFGWFTNESDYNFQPDGKPWYNDFNFSKAVFPEPQEQLKMYKDNLHFRMGGIRKPRLGNTDLLTFAKSKGWIFPGGEADRDLLGLYAMQRNVNYSIPEARDWYAQQQAHYYSDGVSFFWNDEGETDFFTFYWWNVAQLQSLRMKSENKRFFSINRAWSPGIARLGATVWTGDITPTWEDLYSTPGFLLNWGLGGAPYVTCDIGGFTGQTTGLLLTRWLQVGAFLPIMRVHSTKSATPHFPWLWDGYSNFMREALNLRYQLVPYHYSLAHKMFLTNRLWMRPLAAEFPEDETALPISTQWFDGDLLVAPILSEDNNKQIYLPKGTWYNFNGSTVTSGPKNVSGSASVNEIPVFVRPGAIVPLAPVIQSTDALPGGPLEVQIYSGADGSFVLVEDDGETTAYENGEVRQTALTWSDSSKTLSWTVRGAKMVLPNAFTMVYVAMFSSKGVQHSETHELGQSGSITLSQEIVI
jgi:alpha-glucosidase